MGGTPIRIALAAGLGVALLGARDAGPAAVGALYVAAVTVALVQYDLRERRLPDALVLPGFAFVAVGAVWSALGGTGGLAVIVAPAVCGPGVLLVFLVLASGGGLGMGDVKLAVLLGSALAAVVAERAPPAAVAVTVAVWVVASLVLGGLTAGIVLSTRRAAPGAAHRPSAELPFGPVLLAAFWVVALVP